MTQVPAWHQQSYPEYRQSPPWVMEDMIALEPALAADLERLDTELGPLTDAARTAAEADEPIILIGCGTAWHAAQACADVLSEALGASHKAQSRQSFDAALDPRGSGLCIAVSNGGRSKATLDALEAARRAGASTGLITADPSGPLSQAADHVATTMTPDASWCHTIAYLAPILAAAVLGAKVAHQRIAPDSLRTAIEDSLATSNQARTIAKALDGVDRILTIGSGADAVAARELSLKIEEAAYVPAATHQTENLLHGHLVPCDQTDGLVVLVTDRRSRDARAERAAAALRAARSLGVRTAAIVTEDVDRVIATNQTSAGRIVLKDHTSLPGALASYTLTAAAFQHLTVGLADCAGANPDFIRRDFEPYRRAYDLAEHKFPRDMPATH